MHLVTMPENTTASTSLLDLPQHVLLLVMKQLDTLSLCSASRTCQQLFLLSAHPTLHPDFHTEGAVQWDLRCVLARVLRLPPQIFCLQLDVKRSRRFPVTVPLHNLRPILNITDTEGLAERVSIAVQAQVEKVALWKYTSWQQLPPVASISICRADRSTVRASLRPEAAVPHFLHEMQQCGWPPLSPAPASSGDKDSELPPHSSPGAAAVMDECLQLCHARLAQLAERCWPQRSGGHSISLLPAGSSAACEPRERLALSRTPGGRTAHAAVAAAARHLPDCSTARQAALSQLTALQLNLEGGVAQLVPAAVRLMYIAAAADPGAVSFAAPRRPGWLLLLQQGVRIVVRLHMLTVCSKGHSSDDTLADVERTWPLASASELQLCLAGLQHFPPQCCSPAAVYKCALAVEAAAAEYSDMTCGPTGALAALTLGDCDSSQQPVLHELMWAACQHEVLRALHWCVWLLGVI